MTCLEARSNYGYTPYRVQLRRCRTGVSPQILVVYMHCPLTMHCSAKPQFTQLPLQGVRG